MLATARYGPVPVAPGIYRLPLPLPAPLTINTYIAIGDDGWDVVDTGLGNAECQGIRDSALTALGLSLGQLRRIYVTHAHPDHLGAAGWLQAQSGAPVFMLDRELAAMVRSRGAATELAASLRAHGMPDELAQQVAAIEEQKAAAVQPLPRITPLHDGDLVPLGDLTCQVIWAPGHSQGQYMLWAEADGILFSADHLMASSEANVICLPHLHDDPEFADPLGVYLQQLPRIAALPTRLVLAGHHGSFAAAAGRCRELERSCAGRLTEALALLSGGAARSTWDVAGCLYQRSLVPPLLSLGRTLAFLEHLRHQGRAHQTTGEQGVLWLR